jgi:hypothetical protein
MSQFSLCMLHSIAEFSGVGSRSHTTFVQEVKDISLKMVSCFY